MMDKTNGLYNNTDTVEEAHAEFNPSSLELFERCPGFRKRETGSSSKAAEKGTRIHKALERDAIYELSDHGERHIAQTCKDFIDGLIEERRPALPVHDYREIRLKMDLGDGLTTFGTCDRLILYTLGDSFEGLMLDYKSGYREVADAEFNAQAWCYVVGAFQRFQKLNKITFYFLVPNRDEILSHVFTREDMPRMILRLNTIIRRAMVADPEQFSPQPELCEYCSRQATCPALTKLHLAYATKLREKIQLPKDATVDASRPEDIPHLLRLAPLLESYAKQIREDALRLNLEEGMEIEGFARVTSTTPRGVTSVIGAYEAVKDVVDLDDFLASCSSVSIPDLEDLFAEKAKRGQKGVARQEVENRLRDADVLREGGERYYLREIKK